MMKRRLLSLCMALALCLGLLPATALAAAPPENQVLYVGGVLISSPGYWTTSEDGKTLTSVTSVTESNNYIHYDADNKTLTLHNATIKEALDYGDDPPNSLIFGAAIGVLNQNGAAELTITLEGTNTIAEVGKGIYVLASSTSTGGATLTITGGGSLTASGSVNAGILVQSNGGNATLSIENAEVTTTSSSSDGVLVQAKDGSNASLTVNGGSLTVTGSGTTFAGIQLQIGSSDNGSGTPSLNVSNSAIVRANGSAGGITSNSSTGVQYGTGSNSTGGIVFNGNEGTVYGSVTLQEDLTVENGQTLTIPDGASLTIDSGATLTNEGTVTTTGDGTLTNNGKIENSGTLPDDIDGTAPPSINTTSLAGGTVGTAYNATLAASGTGTITWSNSGNLPAGLTLDENTGVISGTPTADGTFNFTVKAKNDGGSDSKELSITIGEQTNVPVNCVLLNKTSTTLTVGNTETLTATVEPANATNKAVTWSSDNSGVATVSNGVVTAVTPGTATITVTAQGDSTKSASCTVTVTAAAVPVTGVTLNKTSTSLYVGDTETLTPTITPDNATNKNLTWSSDDTSVATVDARGLVTAVSAGTATITVTTEDGAKTATCTVTVSRYSSGGGSSSSSTSLSDRAIDDIQDARPGDTVEITLRPGRTTLEREVFEALAGQDITLEIDAGDGVLWTVNGLDIPEDTRLHDLDLDVDLGDSDIPATVLNAVTGEIGTVQLSLAHDGEFGFTMTLSVPLGRDNADYWANLYWFNEGTEELEFQQAARIAKDGTAEFALDHASDYAIVIDDRSHEPVDLPFNDVPEGYWAYDAIQYVYGEGLMAGTSGSTFSPEGATTRGQIVTILWRLSGSPVVNYLMDFDDVDPAAYYAEAIRWATSEGIAGGYGNGSFGPNDPITREQLAVMLYQYAWNMGYDLSIGEDTNILSYADAFDVSEYAVSALQWACGAGIISGTGDGSTLSPGGSATRSQVAMILMRFCQEFVEEAN